jgi:eukaryotic-like serine/threonine-protein kinase
MDLMSSNESEPSAVDINGHDGEKVSFISRYSAFISYSRKDEAAARKIADKLQRFNIPSELRAKRDIVKNNRLIEIFVDHLALRPGGLKEEIERSLNSADSLIIVCTPNANDSSWIG